MNDTNLTARTWRKSIPELQYTFKRGKSNVKMLQDTWNNYKINQLDREDMENGNLKLWLCLIVELMNFRYLLLKKHKVVTWQEYLELFKNLTDVDNEITKVIEDTDYINKLIKKYHDTELINIIPEITELLYTKENVVVIADELADLFYEDKMKTASERKLDNTINKVMYQRYFIKLATLGRASGIHLILGTQRPDATILTGQLRANIPTRIALRCVSSIDKKIVLGVNPKEHGLDIHKNIINYKSELYYLEF